MIADYQETALPGNPFSTNNAGAEDNPKDDGEEKLTDTVIEEVEAGTHSVLYTKRGGAATLGVVVVRRQVLRYATKALYESVLTMGLTVFELAPKIMEPYTKLRPKRTSANDCRREVLMFLAGCLREK